MVIGSVSLVLGFAPIAGSLVQDEELGAKTVEAQDEDLEAVRSMLTAARAALEAEDLVEARRSVEEAVTRFAMLGDGAASAIASELDDLAGELGVLKQQLAVRERVLKIRERLLPADHPKLLDAKLGLAATLGQLGDLAGALALEG